MAFDATTPFALACLGDSSKSKECLKVLTGGQSADAREKELLGMTKRWNVAMSDKEAHEVVAEYDRVHKAHQPAAKGLAMSMESNSAIS